MRFIRLNENNEVINVRIAKEIVDGEIKSDTGELGQIMRSDGTFVTQDNLEIAPQITLEQRVEQLQQDNLILMDALASVYEELLTIKSGGTA